MNTAREIGFIRKQKHFHRDFVTANGGGGGVMISDIRCFRHSGHCAVFFLGSRSKSGHTHTVLYLDTDKIIPATREGRHPTPYFVRSRTTDYRARAPLRVFRLYLRLRQSAAVFIVIIGRTLKFPSRLVFFSSTNPYKNDAARCGFIT